MKLYAWIVDKLTWLLVALLCAIVGSVIGIYIPVILEEVCK